MLRPVRSKLTYVDCEAFERHLGSVKTHERIEDDTVVKELYKCPYCGEQFTKEVDS